MSADGAFFFPFGKEERQTFSLPKRKSYKKKLVTWQVECLRVWKPYTAKPTRLCAEACVNAELSAWRKGISPLVVLWKALIVWNFFLLVRRQSYFSPKSLFYSLEVCTTALLSVDLRDFVLKIHWGLNKTVGISAILTMHHAEGKASIRTRKSEYPSASENLRVFGEQTVLRLGAGFCAEPLGIRGISFPNAQAIKPQVCLLLFCKLFSFRKRKKLTAPL